MKLIDLSMPIWEGAGYSDILPMPNNLVQFYEYTTYEWNGIRRTFLKIDDESGSPFMTIWQRVPHTASPIAEGGIYTWKLDEIPLERLIMRDTVVLDVPGEDYHEITAADIDAAVAKADYREGDDVLVRTGWASVEKAYELGDRYCLLGPSWTYESCIRMAEIAEQKKSGVVMTDAPLIMTPKFQGWGWSVGEEKIVPKPKSWPSIEARERIMNLSDDTWPPQPGDVERPAWIGSGGYRQLMVKTIAICKCLVNAHLITQPRVKMIMMPLLIKEGGAAPCRFIAVEE